MIKRSWVWVPLGGGLFLLFSFPIIHRLSALTKHLAHQGDTPLSKNCRIPSCDAGSKTGSSNTKDWELCMRSMNDEFEFVFQKSILTLTTELFQFLRNFLRSSDNDEDKTSSLLKGTFFLAKVTQLLFWEIELKVLLKPFWCVFFCQNEAQSVFFGAAVVAPKS